MDDCVFCKIISGEFPSKKAYEDDTVLAFYDINPSAPVHILVVPKAHDITAVSDFNDENGGILSHIFAVIARIAKDLGLEKGYRVVSNIGDDAGQTVLHLHFHLLAGRNLGAMAER